MGNLKEGMYDAGPLTAKLVVSSKKGTEMMAFAVIVDDGDGGKHELIKNGGLTEASLAYTVQDAENLGCDTSLPMSEWKVDPSRKLRVRIEIDEYGPKVKSIFDANKGVPAEAILKKQEMPIARQKEISALLADRIKALKALSPGGGGTGGDSGGLPF